MTFRRPPPRERQYEGAWSPAVDAGRAIPATKRLVAVALAPARPMPKAGRHESTPWRRAVASLPCVLCGKEGDTQCAHRNEGKGMALKTDDASTAALCTECHRGIDQGKDMSREERRATMDRAIVLTIVELARRGLVVAIKEAA